MSVNRNLVANYLGQGWSALMGLAFVPLYIHYLGVEAYGLIGFFTVMVTWLSVLDMGMTPIISREMARFEGGGHSATSIRDLLRSIEFVMFAASALIAGGSALLAPLIADEWLLVETLSVGAVANAVAVMGLVAAARFAEGMYRSSLVGLQRQVTLNIVTALMATVRGLGAVAILAWISPTITSFFLWQGLASLLTLIILATATYRVLPSVGRRGRFSMAALRSVRRFAGGMVGITVMAVLLTQADKIILSKLLSLTEYGYYTLAATAASSVFLLIMPISQAWFPRLCELHMREDKKALANLYHTGAQLVSVVGGGVAVVLILLTEQFLRLWTQNADLAERVAPVLRLLLLGNLLNGLMQIPYQTQLAHGWTSLTGRINVVSVVFVVPAFLFVTPRYGSEGAAWVWVGLNAGYVLIGAQFMYQRILVAEKWRWYGQDLLLPLAAGFGAGLFAKLVWQATGVVGDPSVLLIVVSIAAFGASFALSRKLVDQVKKLVRAGFL